MEVVKMGEIFRTFAAEYSYGGRPRSLHPACHHRRHREMEGVETIDLQYSLSTSTANKSVLCW